MPATNPLQPLLKAKSTAEAPQCSRATSSDLISTKKPSLRMDGSRVRLSMPHCILHENPRVAERDVKEINVFFSFSI